MVSYAGINEISVSTGQSRSAYSALLKSFYGPKWDNWIHTEAKIADKIAKKKGMMGGQQKVNALSLSLPQSAGISSGEGYYLPEPSTGTHVNPRIVARDFYTRLRWTGQSQRSARAGNQAAWSKPRQSDVEDAREQSMLNFARKLYNGYYDVLGRVALRAGLVGDTRQLTLDGRDGRLYGSSDVEAFYHFGAHYMRAGQIVQAVATPAGVPTITGNSNANMIKIDSIDDSSLASPTITVSATIGSAGSTLAAIDTAIGGDGAFAAGDLVIPYASRQDTIASDDTKDTSFFTMNGVASVVLGTTHYSTLYGLSKSTYGKLSGINDHGSTTAREAQEDRLTYLVHRIRNEGSGGTPDIACLHDSVLRELIKENQQYRRFAPIQQGERGYSDMTHMMGSTSVKYMEDWLCPPGLIYALDTTQWGYFSESDLAPLDEPQQRFIPNYDQTEMVWHKSGNVECRKPHNNGILDELEFNLAGVPD